MPRGMRDINMEVLYVLIQLQELSSGGDKNQGAPHLPAVAISERARPRRRKMVPVGPVSAAPGYEQAELDEWYMTYEFDGEREGP